MRETWYVLEDGNVADPNEVSADAAGKLFHKSGVAVAMRGDVPHSRGVDTPATPAYEPVSPKNRQMKAVGAKKYETR